MAERIQLKRTKGWRMPENTVKVDRTTKWGNPFRVGYQTSVWHRPGSQAGCPDEPVYRDTFIVVDAAHSIRLFRHAVLREADWYHDTWEASDFSELRGKNLACWCPLHINGGYSPCHADVLLSLANDVPMEEVIRENLRRSAGEAVR